MTARTYDLTLAPAGQAGQTSIIEASGLSFKVIASAATVEVRTETGVVLDLSAGQGFRGMPFKRLVVTNRGSVANAVRIVIAFGEMIDSRVSGSVEVVDAAKASSVANANFLAFCETSSLVGQRGYIQLWNASAKNLYVDRVRVHSWNKNLYGHVMVSATALATVSGTVQSKLFGTVAASLAGVTCRGNSLVSPPAVIARVGFLSSTQSNTGSCDFNKPIVITPNTGLLLEQQFADSQFVGQFDFTSD